MKKSTATVILAFIVCFVTLSAANLKLKKAYDKGEIKTLFITRPLPPFSYVKETLNEVPFADYRCTIAIKSSTENTSGVDSLSAANVDFNVINDTLFITPSKEAVTTNTPMYSRININATHLKGIIARKNTINFTGGRSGDDSLTVTAFGRSQVNLSNIKTGAISINASGTSKVTIEATDSINNVIVNLKDKSCFSANNVILKSKVLHMSDSCSLQLTGKSIVDFGIK